MRLGPPHGALLDVAEAMALAAFEELVSGAREEPTVDASPNGSHARKRAGGRTATHHPGHGPAANGPAAGGPAVRAFDALPLWLEHADPSLPLQRVAEGFALRPSEAALLVLLFAAALSEHVARHVAASTNAGGQGVPVWLAQRLISDLRIDSLAAAAPLRRFGLVGVEQDALRIEARLWLREAMLDRFCGAPANEPDVLARIAPASVNAALASDELAHQLRAALVDRGPDGLSPAVFTGNVEAGTVAASLAAIGLQPHVTPAACIPDDPDPRDRIARMWSRDAALDGAALIVSSAERGGAALADFVDRVAGHVVVIGERPALELRRAIRILGDDSTGAASAGDRWRRALGRSRSDKLGAGLARVASQFRLSAAEIDAVCARVEAEIDAAEGPAAAAILWHAAGRVAPTLPVPGVSMVEPAYRWSDIVLAPPIEAALRRVEMHVRHATTVLDDWGFGERMGGRGRGVTALFAGPSGTGKTMAAEVLATSLDLRMMVIDLSQIISKYIGETSKNIAAAFDQAERSGAVMVWNEGDAVWGSRGTVGNATDRHVNAEVGDLLQRIEAFRGFTIVTTNMRRAIDPAFLRRFRFAIDFPMPTETERLRLWAQVFPKDAPVDRINWRALAALPLTGGSIRNVALGSAFLAAEDGGRIDARLIAAELAVELQKHDQPMPAINWGAST
jgi:hypothetical protein